MNFSIPESPLTPPFLSNSGEDMNCHEKYQHYASSWASVKEKKFETPKVARLYEQRSQRILDAIALKEPDEVPVYLMAEGYILTYSGIQPRDAFYNIDKFASALLKLHEDFYLDYSVLTFVQSGNALETLGTKIIRWPGSALPGSALPDDTSFQYVEDEYMRADEYDELINNPEGYILRKYFPRIFTNLKGFANLPNAFNLIEVSGFAGSILGLATGSPVRDSFEYLLKAANQAGDILTKYLGAYRTIQTRYGMPHLFGGISKAPFDIIGDTMRCTVGIVKDIYNQPEKVLAAVEALVTMAVQMGAQNTCVAHCLRIVNPYESRLILDLKILLFLFHFIRGRMSLCHLNSLRPFTGRA